MAETPLPLAAYPPVLLDAVAYAAAGDFELSVKTMLELDPELALTQFAAMFGELVRRYERVLNLEPGMVLPRLRAHYAAVDELTPEQLIPPRDRRSRHVVR